MMIINSSSRTEARRRFGKSTVAFLLVALLILSTILVSVPIAFAKVTSTYFDHQEVIYIDLREFTNWNNDSAAFRVFTYYGDSEDNWNVENNAADSTLTGSTALANALVPESVATNVYKFTITGDKVGYVKVMRVDSSISSIWNTSGYMFSDDQGSSNNCIKITGWDSSASWSKYTATPGPDGQNVFTANPDSSITDNSNLYQIDATFYDYYTNDEYSNGWRSINYSSSHGDWEPYEKLNSLIAAEAGSVAYPLYFGNFYDKNDGYTGTGSSNMVRFSNWVNNSARLGGYNRSVINLAADSLVNDQIYYRKNSNGGTTYNGDSMPFFDRDWLTGNKIGTIVDTKFPMRKVTDSYGNTSYVFDSTGATDNVWFSNYESDTLTISYGAGTANGSKDALYYYSSPREDSGYGFFPFDHGGEAYDFAFGMRADVDFNVAKNGLEKGNVHQKFSFSGDDDLWVYVDGELVLDIGGDHKKAEGYIDFATKQAVVTTGTNDIADGSKLDTRTVSFDFDNTDNTKTHTLTMFYMERGMAESNLSFGFNFSPVGNQLGVEKTVNNDNVNDGLKDAVKNVDSFDYTITQNGSTASDKTYTHSTDGTTTTDGTFSLENGEIVVYNDQFTVSDALKVSESFENSILDYSTTWSLEDISAGSTTTGTGKDCSFTFKTASEEQFAATKFALSYVNTVNTGSVEISKTVSSTLSDDSAKTFPVTVAVSLDGGTNYSTYPLVYTQSGETSSATMTEDGVFEVADGKSYTISGLPIGAVVKVTETDTKDLVATYSPSNEVTVSSSSQTIAITNTRSDITPATVDLELTKTLTGATLDEGKFSFTLTEKNIPGYDTGSISTSYESKNGSDGTVKFSFTTNAVAGKFLYEIKENGDSDDTEVTYATNTVTAVVTIELDSANNKYVVTDINYSQGSAFENTFNTGSVTIKKTVSGDDAPADDTFNINVSVGISSDYSGYANPYYTVDGGSEQEFDNTGSAKISVSANTVITVAGLPVKSTVTVSEDKYDPYTTTYTVDGTEKTGPVILTVGSNLTVNNEYAPATANIKANKTLTDKAVLAGKKAEDFSFTLKNTSAPSGISLADDNTVSAGTDGSVVFDTITYTTAGVYEYTITENNSDDDMIANSTVFNAVVNVTKASASSDLTAAVTYYDSSGSVLDETDVVFENDVKKGSITITKILLDYDDTEITDGTEFSITASITYPNNTTASQSFTLTSKASKTISDLPYGTQVVVTETLADGAPYTVTYMVDGSETSSATVSKESTVVTVTNKRSKPGTATGKVTGTKTLDGTAYTGSLFKFDLTGLAPFEGETGVIDTSSVSKSTDSVTNGAFEISGLEFSDPGTYRYKVVESLEKLASIDSENNTTYSSDIYKSDIEYLVVFTVENQFVDGQPKLVPSGPVYYAHDPSDTIDAEDFKVAAADTMTFQNFTQKGSISVEKENQAGEKVEGVTFAVYAVDSSFISGLSGKTDEEKYNAVKELTAVNSDDTDSNGHAEINDLPIYTSNYSTAGGNPTYQQYVMIELSGPDGYSINKTVHTFSFPTIGDGGTPQYSYTFEYINGVLKTPTTAGPGMTMFKILGIILAILSMMALTGYLIYSKKAVKVRNGRHFK